MDMNMLASLPAWFIAFLFSTICHEAAHALAGKWGGDNTAAAQVTLDPTPHIKREPIGMIVVPLVSFFFNGWMIGWASAPYDPLWAARHPKRAALMAAAGPTANFLLVLISAGVIQAGLAMGHFAPPQGLGFESLIVDASGKSTLITTFVSVMFSLNLVLGCFNLLPVPPLDGNGVVPLFLNRTLGQKWTALWRGPQSALIGLVVAWMVFGKLFSPVFLFAAKLLHPGLTYG